MRNEPPSPSFQNKGAASPPGTMSMIIMPSSSQIGMDRRGIRGLLNIRILSSLSFLKVLSVRLGEGKYYEERENLAAAMVSTGVSNGGRC